MPVLTIDQITTSPRATTKEEAIQEAADILVAAGAVTPDYADAMREREASVSTYMGNLLAIPHGTNEFKGAISHSALSFVRYPAGIDWNGKETKFVVGIAGEGDDHLALLRQLAGVFSDKSRVAELEAAQSADDVLAVLQGVAV